MTEKFIAFDLGAESGRALVGILREGRLETDVVHRFPTHHLTILDRRQWNAAAIHAEILRGIQLSVEQHGPDFDGIAIDTWGVDFGLIDRSGTMLGNPLHYRDKRNDGVARQAHSRVGEWEMYERTGIVALPFNTIYQLVAMAEDKAPVLEIADQLLYVGTLLGYWLSGKTTCEYTIASTGQMLRAGTLEWDLELIQSLGIPTHFLPEVTPPGTILGPVLPAVCSATGLGESTPFISGAIHDTACAVVSVPVEKGQEDWAYLSSGTWSLLGAELDEPHVTRKSLDAFYTNEGGVGGKIRFLKNIFGLWIIQECRRCWLSGGLADESELEYGTLVEEAGRSEAFRSVINLEDPRLMAPDNMPDLLATMCSEAGEPIPRTRGEYIRCAMESLALCYRANLRRMDGILDRNTRVLHIIGGGTQNTLLNQMAADACGVTVKAGPVEATAMGNIMVQAIATGAVDSLAEAREIIARSSPINTYEPGNPEAWDNAAKRVRYREF